MRVRKSIDEKVQTLLVGMNPEQAQVVKHHQGPLLVGAVAGSGKTRALVHRIAYLIWVHLVDPARILAVTFSVKAAAEMNDRLSRLGVVACRVGTFHSLAWEITKSERQDLAQWDVDDRDQYRSIIKEATGFRGMDWKTADVTQLQAYIGFCKAELAKPGSERSLEIAVEFIARTPKPCSRNPGQWDEAYGRAEVERETRCLVTFDDMLTYAHDILSQDPEARARWQGRYDFVLQDEAQDQNHAQNSIAAILSQVHRNYMIVGDPAQSIYGFRGARPATLLGFESEWSAQVVYMARNYRCGRDIVRAANGALEAMSARLDMSMVAERPEAGEVTTSLYENQDFEGEAVTREAQQLNQDGQRWSSMVVLYRTNAQSRGIEEAMLSARIPYVVIGGVNFYERREVRDVLAYLRVAEGRAGFEDVKRCINSPFRFLGRAFVDRIDAEPATKSDPWDQVAVRAAQGAGIQARQIQSVRQWAGVCATARAAIQANDKPAAILEEILSATQYVQWLERDQGAESTENNRVSNVRELVRAAERFSTARELLDYVDDVIRRAKEAKLGQQGDRVTLMSIHRSKGLEFGTVWLIGANEGILPHGRAEDPEEERRLWYVACTRAKDRLRISCVDQVVIGGKVRPMSPSRFYAESGLTVQAPGACNPGMTPADQGEALAGVVEDVKQGLGGDNA